MAGILTRREISLSRQSNSVAEASLRINDMGSAGTREHSIPNLSWHHFSLPREVFIRCQAQDRKATPSPCAALPTTYPYAVLTIEGLEQRRSAQDSIVLATAGLKEQEHEAHSRFTANETRFMRHEH